MQQCEESGASRRATRKGEGGRKVRCGGVCAWVGLERLKLLPGGRKFLRHIVF